MADQHRGRVPSTSGGADTRADTTGAGGSTRPADAAAMAATAPSAFVLLTGLWLVVSRLTFAYMPMAGPNAYWNGVIIGSAVTFVAMLRLSSLESSPMLSLVNAALGAWIVGSLWAFHYENGPIGSLPARSDLIAGGATVVLAAASFAAGVRRARA